MGIDQVHPLLLKKCAEQLGRPLSIIFNKSSKTGQVPNKWKEASITQIFKKGSKTIAGNYKGISLCSIVCKIMETLIKKLMIKHLDKHELVGKNQHGFVKSESCSTNLLEIIDTITLAMNQRISVDQIFLDFAKAFDTVCTRALLLKLNSCGFNGAIYNWLSSFLTNRRQRVVIGEHFRMEECLEWSTPRFSPWIFLFIIYINDMPSLTSHICKLRHHKKF